MEKYSELYLLFIRFIGLFSYCCHAPTSAHGTCCRCCCCCLRVYIIFYRHSSARECKSDVEGGDRGRGDRACLVSPSRRFDCSFGIYLMTPGVAPLHQPSPPSLNHIKLFIVRVFSSPCPFTPRLFACRRCPRSLARR